jgi:hypothetical protein
MSEYEERISLEAYEKGYDDAVDVASEELSGVLRRLEKIVAEWGCGEGALAKIEGLIADLKEAILPEEETEA